MAFNFTFLVTLFVFPNLRCTIVETEALLLIVPLYGVQSTVAEVCLICLKI